ARELPGFQDNGADRRALVEGGDGHEDLGIWKRLSQDRWDRRRRVFEHVSSYSSGRWPTRKPSFPLRAPHGGIPAIRVLPTFSKRDEKASHHPPFRIHRNRIHACVCPRLSLRRSQFQVYENRTLLVCIVTVICPGGPCRD